MSDGKARERIENKQREVSSASFAALSPPISNAYLSSEIKESNQSLSEQRLKARDQAFCFHACTPP